MANTLLRMTVRWLLGLACAMALCGAATARDLAAIKASGKIVVAVPDMNSPPFFMEQNGELKGIDINLARSIADSLGVAAEFNRQGKSFNDAVELVETDKADMAIAKISRTVKRAQSVLFSDPYVTLNHGLMVNRLRFAAIANERPVAEVMQHYTGSIGVIANSSFAYYAHIVFPKANIVELPSWKDVVEAVAQGKITAAYRDALEVRLVLKEQPDLAVNIRPIIIEDIQDSIGIAMGPNNVLLQNFVNMFLQQNKIKYGSEDLLTEYKKYIQ